MTSTSARHPATVVRASAPQDLLALAAHTLGFWPWDSLVLVALHGPRRRSGLVVRADLVLPGRDGARAPGVARGRPGDGSAEDLDDLLAPVAASGAEAVVALLCDPAVTGPGPAHAALAAALAATAGAHGLELVDATLMGGRRHWSLTCSRPCCPPSGVPLDVTTSAVAAHAVLAGSAPAPTRRALLERATASTAPAPRAERDAVATALADHRAPSPGGDAAVLRTWWDLLHRRPSDPALDPVLDPASAAALLTATEDLLLRDALMVSLLPTGAQHLGLGDGPVPSGRAGLRAAVEATLRAAGAQDHPGDHDLARSATAVLERLCSLAPDGHRAGVTALLAHLHWWHARPLHAEALAAGALAIEPGHGLAALVAALVAAGAPPDWAGRRRGGRRAGAAGPRRAA